MPGLSNGCPVSGFYYTRALFAVCCLLSYKGDVHHPRTFSLTAVFCAAGTWKVLRQVPLGGNPSAGPSREGGTTYCRHRLDCFQQSSSETWLCVADHPTVPTNPATVMAQGCFSHQTRFPSLGALYFAPRQIGTFPRAEHTSPSPGREMLRSCCAERGERQG